MAFKEVSDLSTDTTISLGGTNNKTGKKNPTNIEGYYLGRKEVADQKKKTGKSYIYIFQTPKGNVGVWGKTDMDRKMEAATPGVMLRITHTGFTATPNGDMYKYKVEFDADNTIEVQAQQTATNDIDETTDEEPVAYTSEEADEDEAAQDEQLAALEIAAAQRKAKLAALLGKNKKPA